MEKAIRIALKQIRNKLKRTTDENEKKKLRAELSHLKYMLNHKKKSA